MERRCDTRLTLNWERMPPDQSKAEPTRCQDLREPGVNDMVEVPQRSNLVCVHRSTLVLSLRNLRDHVLFLS